MMIAMLVAGIGCLLAGLLAIGFGIPVNEFSFGNTLILCGAVVACTGLVILSLWAAVRELKGVARSAASNRTADRKAGAMQPRPDDAESAGPAIGESAGAVEVSAAPRQEATAERRRKGTLPELAPEAEPASRPRRNLMFSSTARQERERAQARAPDSSEPGSTPFAATPPASGVHEAPATFDDAWPKSERARAVEPSLRRPARPPSTFSQAPASDRQPAEEQPPVTVLKSGVVDGMAYSLYSDGSIEAQMPEGMMRFASIDELRAHLDQRL